MEHFHIRLVLAVDHYIEAETAEQAEDIAILRCEEALVPYCYHIGFLPTFHYKSHATLECRNRDSDMETVTTTLQA